jgi:predicted nucleotidyltransferase
VRFGLSERVVERVTDVFKRHSDIEKVIIYGSRAKGTFRTGSDIDLTLLGEPLAPSLLSVVASELDALNTPYLFDLSIFSELTSQDLIEHVERVGQVFYQRPPSV